MRIKLDALALALRDIRGKRTLADLAKLTGRSISYLAGLESGQRTPSLETLLAYSRAMQRGHKLELIIDKDMQVDLKNKVGY